jgi:nucleoside-diphosphate-sugar epimerase
MKILMIGGTKFIGLATTLALHKLGHQVAVFNRGQTPAELPEGIERITGDANKLLESQDALRAFAPDVVLHNIVRHDEHVRDVQTVFTGVAKRFVMTSSMDVYQQYGRLIGKEPGPVIEGYVDEDSPVRSVLYPYRNADTPEDHFGYTYDKIPAEQLALSSTKLPGTVVRLPMVIGENDFQRRLLAFVQAIRDQRPALVLDENYAKWYSTYGYVENMAHALALAATNERASGRIYNAADGAYQTIDLAERVKKIMGWQGEFIPVASDKLPESLKFEIAVPEQNLMVKAERIRELGYAPVVDFDEGVKRAVAWEIANPPDPMPEGLTDYTAQDEVLKTLQR